MNQNQNSLDNSNSPPNAAISEIHPNQSTNTNKQEEGINLSQDYQKHITVEQEPINLSPLGLEKKEV